MGTARGREEDSQRKKIYRCSVDSMKSIQGEKGVSLKGQDERR